MSKLKLEYQNNTLDDIAAIIGFTPTLRLTAVCGGKFVRFPAQLSGGHWLAKMIGQDNVTRLMREFDDEVIYIPLITEWHRWSNLHAAATMAAHGVALKDIAGALRLSEVHAKNLLEFSAEIGRLKPKTDASGTITDMVGEIEVKPEPTARKKSRKGS